MHEMSAFALFRVIQTSWYDYNPQVNTHTGSTEPMRSIILNKKAGTAQKKWKTGKEIRFSKAKENLRFCNKKRLQGV